MLKSTISKQIIGDSAASIILSILTNPKSEIRNHKSEITNPKSEIRNPKEIRNQNNFAIIK